MKELIKGVTVTMLVAIFFLGIQLLSNYIHYGTFLF